MEKNVEARGLSWHSSSSCGMADPYLGQQEGVKEKLTL